MEAKWIDVNNHMPTEDGWYLCTVDVNGTQRYVMDLFFRGGKKKWLDNRRNGCNKALFDRTDDVVAWMKQPEPYMFGFETNK